MAVSCNPPVATGHEDYSVFQHSSPTPANTQNRVLTNLWNLPSIGGTGPANLVSHGATNPELAEIASSEICGFTFDGSNDSYGSIWHYPVEIDLTGDVDFRVIWSESGTGGSGTGTFTVVYTPIALETTALSVGATALDTIIAADPPSTTANCIQATAFGTLTGGTISPVTYEPGEAALAIKTYVTFATITDSTVYELQARYYRRFIG